MYSNGDTAVLGGTIAVGGSTMVGGSQPDANSVLPTLALTGGSTVLAVVGAAMVVSGVVLVVASRSRGPGIETTQSRPLPRSPVLYYAILGFWALLLIAATPPMYATVVTGMQASLLIGGLAAMSAAFIAYFWLNGVKDLVYTLCYHLVTKHRMTPVPVRVDPEQPKVVMVYCTYNDFSAESLELSMAQDYGNYEAVILDDSTDPEYMGSIDEFATKHGIRVVRREDRTGFKAGNLNNFLRCADYDFFVILDSDEITPPEFISRALDYFAHYDNVGIVQANHIATRNRNPFMRAFAAGVDSHWISYQTVKNQHGFLSLLGHGAMVSKACYDAADGFPKVVAEDLCLSITARDAGYVTAFASDIICEEEYPVDYLAFKKRHSKWTQGNMEFIKRYTSTIVRSKMTWFEKLDIVLFTYSLPLTALFSLFVATHVIVLPILGHQLEYPLWMLAPTVLFLIAPMLNDFIFHFRSMKKRHLARYLIGSALLYGSMFFVSLKASIKSTFGKSVFLVTPKEASRVTCHQALRANLHELLFGVVLAAISLALIGSILPVLLLVVPALSSTFLSRTHNDPKAPQP